MPLLTFTGVEGKTFTPMALTVLIALATAFVLSLTNEGHTEIEKDTDYTLYVPKTNPYFTNSLAILPLQLFAYYVSLGRGLDVDKPRNLAKSVTVE